MHITLAQAQSIINSRIFGEKLPLAISYKFAKLAKLLIAEMQIMEEERKKLLVSFEAVLPEGTTEYVFPEGNKAEFQTAYEDLVKTTMDIGCHWPMEVPAIDMAPLELMALEPLFDVPEPAPKG